jgi:hypothetical protein
MNSKKDKKKKKHPLLLELRNFKMSKWMGLFSFIIIEVGIIFLFCKGSVYEKFEFMFKVIHFQGLIFAALFGLRFSKNFFKDK